MAKDYNRYKPVAIQPYGVKCDYSEVALEPIGNIDSNTDDTNGTEAKALDVKKEETFSRKLSTWLNISSNNDNKANLNQFENCTSSSPRNNTQFESMIISLFNI